MKSPILCRMGLHKLIMLAKLTATAKETKC